MSIKELKNTHLVVDFNTDTGIKIKVIDEGLISVADASASELIHFDFSISSGKACDNNLQTALAVEYVDDNQITG